ncbi:MAG: TIGR03364 family FAD-dependent oxidoreductase [Myxococcales bacterium]
MIWPIGQPSGECHEIALESRERWLAIRAAAGIQVMPCGSIHLAHQPDEWAVLQEFAAQAKQLGYSCKLLPPSDALAISAANPKNLQGGLYSQSELNVNPRTAIQRIPLWLAEQYGVRLVFETTVLEVSPRGAGGYSLRTSRGLVEPFDHVVICGGTDFQTLFPDQFASSGLKICKLQMLKTKPQPADWRLITHVASGLTLRHYHNFDICPSLATLKNRIATESPELDRYGIHVMASQNDAGEIILGDSHEYGSQIEPFDKSLIDDLMLRELHKIIRLPDWTIAEAPARLLHQASVGCCVCRRAAAEGSRVYGNWWGGNDDVVWPRGTSVAKMVGILARGICHAGREWFDCSRDFRLGRNDGRLRQPSAHVSVRRDFSPLWRGNHRSRGSRPNGECQTRPHRGGGRVASRGRVLVRRAWQYADRPRRAKDVRRIPAIAKRDAGKEWF